VVAFRLCGPGRVFGERALEESVARWRIGPGWRT
jgi:hypothetical protein